MLILTRKLDESIKIGDAIEVRIVEIKGDQVKIGIEAPRSIPVHRKEVYLAIQKENMDAVSQNVNNIDNIKNLIKNQAKK